MDKTLGAAFLGSIVAAVLYGAISIQAFLFLKRRREKEDFVCWRVVSMLWYGFLSYPTYSHVTWHCRIMDTANLVFIAHALYYYMISNYGNPSVLASPTWSILALVYVTCASNLFIRYGLGRWAWSMTSRRVLLTLVPSLGAFAAGTAFSSLEWKIRTFEHFTKISYLLYISFASGFAADGIIAITLCAGLRRRRTGFPRTDSMLKTLILYTANTGILTRQVFFYTLACFIVLAVRPPGFMFIAFYCILSKMYLSSLLAVLNGRVHLIRQAAAPGLVNIPAKQPGGMEDLHPRRCTPIIVDVSQDVVSDDLESQESPPSTAEKLLKGHAL
ncbi:hypothetical protein BD779DRAFT_1677411 [Infundibulicybe gibba]|nr:hypothetical protein BD779DRAFT_1677411 [Infundibulicybe gibba]